jgi:cytoskeletal protein CcmA (bactofilin family)
MSEEQGAFIAQGTQIRGRIYGDADVVVEGSVEGSVSISRTLFVEPQGSVEAEVTASQVEARGQLGGNIRAHDTIHLEANSNTTATLRAPRIEVDEGARLEATFDMDVELPPGVELPELDGQEEELA